MEMFAATLAILGVAALLFIDVIYVLGYLT
jgi:hypothetical protein